jgi:hypothetical protein
MRKISEKYRENLPVSFTDDLLTEEKYTVWSISNVKLLTPATEQCLKLLL